MIKTSGVGTHLWQRSSFLAAIALGAAVVISAFMISSQLREDRLQRQCSVYIDATKSAGDTFPAVVVLWKQPNNVMWEKQTQQMIDVAEFLGIGKEHASYCKIPRPHTSLEKSQ